MGGLCLRKGSREYSQERSHPGPREGRSHRIPVGYETMQPAWVIGWNLRRGRPPRVRTKEPITFTVETDTDVCVRCGRRTKVVEDRGSKRSSSAYQGV